MKMSIISVHLSNEINFSEIDFDLKHLIILEGRNPLVVLFLRHMHLKHDHEAFDCLRALIQRRLAVLKLRSTLRSIRFSWVLCRKRNATPVQPMMADLRWVSESTFHQRGPRLLWTFLCNDTPPI